MGVFACRVCGDPCAWDSLTPAGLTRHKCPGPPPEPPGGHVRCPYCKQSDPEWRGSDLKAGKRGMSPGPGVEYHCMNAFYSAS